MQTRTCLARLDGAWTKTDEGYLETGVWPTKAGVFKYLNKDGSIRRELRPRAEVHDAASLASLQNKPITNSHPPELLNSRNTRKYQVGVVHGDHQLAEDRLHTQARALVTDEDAIRDIQQGKQQVSCGYTCDIDFTPGADAEFGEYDAIQRNIRYNHLALEWRGRAGSGARLRNDQSEDSAVRFDALELPEDAPEPIINNKETVMVKIRIDGKEYEVSEAAEVALSHKFKADAQALDTAKAEADAQKARADQMQAKYDAEKARADRLDGMDITAMVKARAALEAQAQRVVKNAKLDSLSDRQVKELVIKERFDWAKTEGQSDDYVNALYESAVQTKTDKNPVLDAYDKAESRSDSFWDQDALAV
jgi:hypothetical protein